VRRIGLVVAGVLAGCGGLPPPPSPEIGSGGPPSAAIVYEHEIDGNKDLYLIPTEGGQPRRLTTDPSDDGLARFTPDGKRSSTRPTWPATGSCSRSRWTAARRGESGPNSYTEWQGDVSPDGRTLAFLSDMDGSERLWLMDVATQACRVLVRHGNQTILGNPHWSPDGPGSSSPPTGGSATTSTWSTS